MSLSDFMQSLWSEGRVRVPRVLEPLNADDRDLLQTLESIDRDARDLFPGDAPALSVPAAEWAAHRFYTICSALAHRDLGIEELRPLLDVRCPEFASPSICYSVDLTLRYLPDVVRLARAASADDPLLVPLMQSCREWPLSSVGVAEVGPVDITAFAMHEALMRVYADRIIERRDRSRVSDPAVAAALREAIGAFSELTPEIAGWLDTPVPEPAAPRLPS